MGDSVVKRPRIVKRRMWQLCVIGTERCSFKNNTVVVIGARWQRRLVRRKKMCVILQRQDKI